MIALGIFSEVYNDLRCEHEQYVQDQKKKLDSLVEIIEFEYSLSELEVKNKIPFIALVAQGEMDLCRHLVEKINKIYNTAYTLNKQEDK